MKLTIVLPPRRPLLQFSAAFLAVAGLVLLANAGGVQQPPKGLAPIRYPADNASNAAKIALGRQLYFDPRLSRDSTVSCATCHDPKKGWSNGERFATGVDSKVGGRSAPTIINTAYNVFQFWDGRAPSLEGQALGPIQNPIEMDLTLPELEKRLNGIDGYRKQFREVFGADVITSDNVAKAIAAYERTLLSGDAPFDRFKAGDEKALSAAAQNGMKLFFGKAHCSACHSLPNFTDNGFHNIGIGMDKKNFDSGRQAISKIEGDTGAFKTPTLREIARTGPYMHDGSLKTLEDVVRYYIKGGINNAYLDEEVYSVKVNDEEIADLVTFLKEGLSSPHYPMDQAPELPK